MATTELRRVQASDMPCSFDLLSQLALKAEAILGYSGLREKLGIPPASLTRALEELGIEPYHSDDIRKYKTKKAKDAEDQAWAEFAKQARLEQGRLGIQEPWGHVMVAGSFVRARWRKVPLAKYQGSVPEFALSRAIEIKERLPKVEFHVEELVVDKRYDPFLIATCGRERFYIDVWDEREFELMYDNSSTGA
jgi:hypothetical protein